MGRLYLQESERSGPWADADAPWMLAGEPRVADMLADDAIKQVMSRDGVAVEQLNTLLKLVRSHLV